MAARKGTAGHRCLPSYFNEGDHVDPRTGIPVYDAYDVTVDHLVGMYRKAGIDTVVFDIAGVGAAPDGSAWARLSARIIAGDWVQACLGS